MVDDAYITQLSSRLRNFKRKSSNLYNFSCPFCGDSKRDKTKARGYLYKKRLKWGYFCHNCSFSANFDYFLKFLAPDLYDEYRFERFKEFTSEKKYDNQVQSKQKSQPVSHGLIDSLLDRVDTLPDDHDCVKFVKSRKIPKFHWSLLYYVDDISKMSAFNEKYKEQIKGTEARLVIPYWNEREQLIALNCRAIYPVNENVKYIMVVVNEDELCVYGRERLDINQRIYVVEGPIDSLFLPNSLAVGVNLVRGTSGLPYKDRMVLVPDNQPRNRQVVKLIERYIDEGFKVFLWPDNIKCKDINDLACAGYSKNDIKHLIDSNIVYGLTGKVLFNNWKKV